MLKSFRLILAQIYFHILTLFHLTKNQKLPLYSKVIALFTVYYFLSPIDLVPDFIPILGQLDDLLIVPFGVWLVYKLTSKELISIAENEAKNTKVKLDSKSIFAILIVMIWVLILALVFNNVFKIL